MPRAASANDITVQSATKIEALEKGVVDINTRFDRHLEIYAQNGKELAGLKVEVNLLRGEIGSVSNNLKWGVRLIIGAVILAMLMVLIPNVAHIGSLST